MNKLTINQVKDMIGSFKELKDNESIEKEMISLNSRFIENIYFDNYDSKEIKEISILICDYRAQLFQEMIDKLSLMN